MEAPVNINDIWQKNHKKAPESHPILSGKEAFHAIFAEHFDEMKNGKTRFRPVVIHEVGKMPDCGNPDNGTFYMCPQCNNVTYVPHNMQEQALPFVR